MQPNPVLRKLGFSTQDRVVIIHTDDIGMCQASVAAFVDLADFGLISSGAIMVPCPWFLEAARYCREHPGVDMGVHATLTSEWETYRWGPISTRDVSTGMIDPEGYFYRSDKQVQQYGEPEAVECEIEQQVQRALAAGIVPTHLDTHMGAVAHPKFIPAYLQIAMRYQLPPMLFRLDEAGWRAAGVDPETAAMAAQMVIQLEEMGLPLLDNLLMVNLEHPENRFEQTCEALSSLPAGLTHFIIHPSKDTPELRAITPDWRCRVADYETFTGEPMRRFLEECGIQVIGYRAVKELMPH